MPTLIHNSSIHIRRRRLPDGMLPVTLAMFFCSPLCSLPFILVGIYKRKTGYFFLFSLFLGLLAWLQLPAADLYRHTMMAYSYKGHSIAYALIASNVNFIDAFTPVVSSIIVNNGIPYQAYRLITVAESFYLLTVIFNYMINHSPRIYTRKEIFIRFLILYFFFEFFQTTNGVRYGFAACQYVFALHLWFNRKSYLPAAIFALLAALIHVSFAFFIPLSIVLFFICKTRSRVISVFVIGAISLIPLLTQFSYLLERRADFYFNGGQRIAKEGSTLAGYILFLGVRFFLIPFIILAYKNCTKISPWSRMAVVWAGLLIIFFVNEDMIFRFALVLATVGPFMLLDVESHVRISKRFVTIILLCGMATTLFNIVNYRKNIYNSRYYEVAMPIPAILNSQYDIPWIRSHINGNTIKHSSFEP